MKSGNGSSQRSACALLKRTATSHSAAHAIHLDEPLIIRDATLDDRTKENPLVTGEPFVRFYAGIPLRTQQGYALGTLCVIDTTVRDITDIQLQSLKMLAKQVVSQLELRREIRSNSRLTTAIKGTRYGLGRATAATFVVGLMVTIATILKSSHATDLLADASLITAIEGGVISLFLASIVWSLGRSRAHAFALAENMTADLSYAKDQAVKRSTELQASREAMKSVAGMLKRTSQMARVGGWELENGSRFVSWSDEVYRIHEVAIGTPISLEQAIAFYSIDAREKIAAAVNAAMSSGTPWDLELPLVTAKGNKIWVRAQGECIHDSKGKVCTKLCGALQDITARRLAEDILRCTATHDRLTGLPNRAMLSDRLQSCLNRSVRHPDRAFAVLFMDFDRFKLTNDTLGHEAGDELLRQIAQRLRTCLRPSDSIGGRVETETTFGRLGGDEFVIILDEVSQPEDAGLVAERLLNTLAAPYLILGHEVVSTASIGVVTSNAQYTSPEELLRDADIAMYEAKLAGKGRFIVFDKEMHDRIQSRVQIESELRKAISDEQLVIYYQPIISLSTAETLGVEALVRWKHPTRGLISPDQFIPVAEETGLIIPIGDWVLRKACEQFQQWKAVPGHAAPASLSVNLSRRQLGVTDLADRVKATLDSTGMAPGLLHLEVTESAVMKDPAFAIETLERLRSIGVRIDMDDFGTGHSSLAMLHQFPIDVLKIDRSFISNITLGKDFVAIVCAIVQLAHNLSISIVAEGIETSEQLAMLQSIDCEAGQGFYFSQPLPANELEAFQARSVGDPSAHRPSPSSATEAA